ncbi:hypothetical protein A0H81_13877 [Grifola frondosa]|uniref:Uncharacterized protein n=1 Tax=Grifola frondosa TaxID=5627 RepID=A0A1C7LTZ6_GRIFR|nr:hypothetical protein A0H81_13877 [Grifola frondosa]
MRLLRVLTPARGQTNIATTFIQRVSERIIIHPVLYGCALLVRCFNDKSFECFRKFRCWNDMDGDPVWLKKIGPFVATRGRPAVAFALELNKYRIGRTCESQICTYCADSPP